MLKYVEKKAPIKRKKPSLFLKRDPLNSDFFISSKKYNFLAWLSRDLSNFSKGLESQTDYNDIFTLFKYLHDVDMIKTNPKNIGTYSMIRDIASTSRDILLNMRENAHSQNSFDKFIFSHPNKKAGKCTLLCQIFYFSKLQKKDFLAGLKRKIENAYINRRITELQNSMLQDKLEAYIKISNIAVPHKPNV